MKIIVNGAGGRMGKAIRAMIEKSPDLTLWGAVDAFCQGAGMVSSLEECQKDADVIIDFSNHAATRALMDYAVATKTPVVVCTTGHTEQELKSIADAAKEIPVFHSGNMSVGIALLTRLAKQTAAMFPDADIEIVESHHNQKLDVPSGTALMLAKAVQEARPEAELNIGRHENGKRKKKEIGIHSLRMGNTVGIHEVIVNTGAQIITLKHEAQDRSLFAEGALTAAAFLTVQKAGLYNMKDLVK